MDSSCNYSPVDSQQQLQSGKFTTAKKSQKKIFSVPLNSSFVPNEQENLLKCRLGEGRVAGYMRLRTQLQHPQLRHYKREYKNYFY